MSIFTDRSRLYPAAQSVRHQLRTIADPQNRDACLKDLLLIVGRRLIIDAVRPAREDDPFGLHLLYLLKAQRVWMHFTIYIAFSDPARDQLIVLPAEVQNDDHFSCQTVFLLGIFENIIRDVPFPCKH